jgi:O-acetyl-ADP-ribose deacetylase (regulator of RNase III)
MLNGLDKQSVGVILDHQNDEEFWAEYREGNILNEFDLDYIVHQCNCFHCMGGGVAAAIANTWPEAMNADNETKYGDKSKMGTYSEARVSRPVYLKEFDEMVQKDFRIINMYSQYTPGHARNENDIELSKESMKNALLTLREAILMRATVDIFEERKYLVGIPWLIGCGIYGMNIDEVYELIRDIFYDYGHVIKIVFVEKK